MMTTMTLSTIPTTDMTIDAIPSFRAPAGSDTALLLATTAHKYRYIQGGPKNGYPVFWDNFGNSAPILTILSLLQAEIYGA